MILVSFVLAYATWVVIIETPDIICLLKTHCHLSTTEKLSVSWPFFKTYGAVNYGSGRKKYVAKQCLESVLCSVWSLSYTVFGVCLMQCLESVLYTEVIRVRE